VRILHEVKWALAGVLVGIGQDRAYLMLVTATVGLEPVGAIFAAGFVLRTSSIFATAWVRVARPRMSRLVGEGNGAGLNRLLTRGLVLLLGQHFTICAINIAGWHYLEQLLLHGHRYEGLFETALAWMVTTTLSQFRGAVSVALQAVREFRFLAFTTGIGATITLAATALLTVACGWQFSVLGLAAGELAACILIVHRWIGVLRRMRRAAAPVTAAGAPYSAVPRCGSSETPA
jgi:hypothetical protein